MTPPEISVATWRQLWRETSDKVADPVETRWLLEEASGLDASDLLRDLDQSPDLASIARLGRLLERRLSGEPLQHVLGHWGFRTLDVVVDSRDLRQSSSSSSPFLSLIASLSHTRTGSFGRPTSAPARASSPFHW